MLLLVFALWGCTTSGSEVSPEDQVPAEQREDNGEPGDGEPGEDGDVAAVVELIAGDIYYENEPSELPAGTTRFVMENEGNLVHNLVLEDFGDQKSSMISRAVKRAKPR